MEVVWARAFHDLQPNAQHVLLACGVLDAPSISLTCAEAVLNAPPGRPGEVLATLTETGWGTVVDVRFAVAQAARSFLRDLVAATSRDEVRLVLDRIATEVVRVAEEGLPAPHDRADVIAVLQAAREHDRLDLVSRIAVASWRTMPVEVDLAWCRELAAAGEDAAVAGRDPELLIELLDLSARRYSTAGDWQGAERAWLRALAVVDDLGDSERFVRFLGVLATNYQNWDRPHKAADALLEIVTQRERGGNAAKTAEALAAVGNIMLDADRLDAAVHYLGQADRLLAGLSDDDPAALARHALALGDLGRAHARGGAINSARTCFHKALAKVSEVDDDVADRIRELQAALPPTPAGP